MSLVFKYGVSIMWLYKYSHILSIVIVKMEVTFLLFLGDFDIYTEMASKYFRILKLS